MKKIVKILLLNSLFLGIFSVIAFGGFELYLRLHKKDTKRTVSAVGIPIFEADRLNTYRHKSNTKAQNGYGDPIPTIQINNIGLRDTDFEKKEYQKNILMIGDSFVFGTGVDQNETFSEVFQKKLNQALPDPRINWQVWNAGHIGYSIGNYFLLAKKYSEILKPDLIIINFFVGNDITELRRKEWELSSEGEIIKVKDLKIFVNTEGKLESRLAPPPKSLAWHELKKRLKILRNKWGLLTSEKKTPTLTWPVFLSPKNPGYDPNLPKYWKRFFKAWSEIDAWAKKKNIPILYTFIPMDVQVDNVYRKKYAVIYFDEEARKADRPQKLMRKFCNEKNLNCLDFLPLFRKDKNPEKIYFMQNADPHLSRYGHEKIADVLLDKILLPKKHPKKTDTSHPPATELRNP